MHKVVVKIFAWISPPLLPDPGIDNAKLNAMAPRSPENHMMIWCDMEIFSCVRYLKIGDNKRVQGAKEMNHCDNDNDNAL